MNRYIGRTVRLSLVIAGAAAIVWGLIPEFDAESRETKNAAYWNHSDSVQYVGMATCGSCHVEIYTTFQHTGMGQSIDRASREKSAGDFSNHPVIRDDFSRFQYQPFWRDDSLYLKEFALTDSGDTLHQLTLPVSYIIGSGQHTNSHLFDENGFLYQMPFTYYTQDAVWDFPPGFENGANSRFSRIIGLECMSCHNAMPTGFVLGSENKFESIPTGIDCERCHGPGSAHVAKIQRGEITDTAKEIDYSIVNPKKLSDHLRFQICQRCHLQGNAVLADGKSFFDFKPGMELKEVMDVYIPRYANDPSFVMASHADRLQQSACYLHSNGQLDCTTCHNPHVSVQRTNRSDFEAACLGCHSESSHEDCLLDVPERESMTCIVCHMPVTSTMDIPHVQVHDHKIQTRPVLNPQEHKNISVFLGLKAINNDAPSRTSRIRAYLQQYERFESDPRYLDSLKLLFNRIPDPQALAAERVNFYYLSGDVRGFEQWIDELTLPFLRGQFSRRSFDNAHAWAAFKTAELLAMSAKPVEAKAFYEDAINLGPYIFDFQVKYANYLVRNSLYSEAITHYQRVLANRPMSKMANGNLGYAYLLLGMEDSARFYLESALRLDPYYESAQANLQLLNR